MSALKYTLTLDSKRVILFVWLMQISVLGLLGITQMELIPQIFSQVYSLVYLLFIPGFLVYSIIGLRKLNSTERLLYIIGFSLASIMVVGFFLNIVLYSLGIKTPLSTYCVHVSMCIFLLLLSIIFYTSSKNLPITISLDFDKILSKEVLLLLMVPLISILGTYLLNSHDNNSLIISLILIIALIVLLSQTAISQEYYPLTVFIISLSLLYHISLISNDLVGWDIRHEFYFSSEVIKNSYWDSSIRNNLNAMLSIIILAPIISSYSCIELLWVFKVVYPFIFSFVPVALFEIYKKQTNGRIAFLSCFFVVGMYSFFGELPQLARQEIAELFLVLWVLTLINDTICLLKKRLLFIIFGFMLIVSHYALSYFFFFALFLSLVCLTIYNKNVYSLKSIFNTKFGYTSKCINSSIVLLLGVFICSWYIYNTKSSSFESLVYHLHSITTNFFAKFLDSDAVQGLNVISTPTHSFLRHINKLILVTNQILIVIGFILVSFNVKGTKFRLEYYFLSLIFLGYLFASVFVPFFASTINVSRLYHFSALFLAPFFVIAISRIANMLFLLSNRGLYNLKPGRSLYVASIYLTIFFLFQTGFMYYSIEKTNSTIAFGNDVDAARFFEEEVVGANWLVSYKNPETNIYSDAYRYLIFNKFYSTYDHGLRPDSYIYLGKINVKNDMFLVNFETAVSNYRIYVETTPKVESTIKIYSNGCSEIYKNNDFEN